MPELIRSRQRQYEKLKENTVQWMEGASCWPEKSNQIQQPLADGSFTASEGLNEEILNPF